MKAEINISRLNYLLELYKLTKQEFLDLISKGLQKPIQEAEVFTNFVSLNHLKRIDKIFSKGLSFYVDPSDPIRSDNASIFFRKKDFNSELNLKSKKIVNEFEDLKLNLSAVASVAEIDNSRILPIFSIKDNPRQVAKKVREQINFSFKRNQRAFLESLINKLGECNILVFEFVETWNQVEKANIDGLYLSPNVIVLKRLDGLSYKREIFTLAHELGHYLLNIEEVEKIDFDVWATKNLSDVEDWCNSFAFYFLLGEFYLDFKKLDTVDPTNDYHHNELDNISNRTNLSKLALYTQLLIDGRISPYNYSRVKADLDQRAREHYEEIRRKIEEEKSKGIPTRASAPTPIKSELFIYLVRTAFHEGLMNEYQVCKTLKIQPQKFDNYIH